MSKTLDEVRPKRYTRRKSKRIEIGFIAEDLPESIQHRDSTGEIVGYDTMAFIAILYAKVLSLEKRIEILDVAS